MFQKCVFLPLSMKIFCVLNKRVERMHSDNSRFWLFWTVCLPIRIFLAGVVLAVGLRPGTRPYLPVLAVYTGCTTLGFVNAARLQRQGVKSTGGFGGPIWWRELRVVHAFLWLGCTIGSLVSWRFAGAFLATDVLVAIVGGVRRHG